MWNTLNEQTSRTRKKQQRQSHTLCWIWECNAHCCDTMRTYIRESFFLNVSALSNCSMCRLSVCTFLNLKLWTRTFRFIFYFFRRLCLSPLPSFCNWTVTGVYIFYLYWVLKPLPRCQLLEHFLLVTKASLYAVDDIRLTASQEGQASRCRRNSVVLSKFPSTQASGKIQTNPAAVGP